MLLHSYCLAYLFIFHKGKDQAGVLGLQYGVSGGDTIQESKNVTKSIELKDYKSYEIVRKRNNYYLYFLPFPVIISFFAVAIVMAVLVLLLLIFWAVIQEKFLVIIGAHSRIEFLAKGISDASLNKFIQSIESLSKEAKGVSV